MDLEGGESSNDSSGDERASDDDASSENDLVDTVDGDNLLRDAEKLFDVGKEVFDLPVEEKQKYDFADRGSYFGYIYLH